MANKFWKILNIQSHFLCFLQLLSGPVVDILTIWYKGEENGGDGDQNEDADYDTKWSLSSYRAILLTQILSSLVACILTLRVREIKVEQHERTSADDLNISSFRPIGGTFKEVLYETIHAPSFRRFLVVCLITLNVRMIFRHLDATVSPR